MENNKSIGNPVPRHGADVFTYMKPRKKKYPQGGPPTSYNWVYNSHN